jgi:hypothetical protein
MPDCKKFLSEALDISQKLMTIANEAETECEHDGCLVLFGIIRECSYKIRMATEKQLKELAAEETVPEDEENAGSHMGPR